MGTTATTSSTTSSTTDTTDRFEDVRASPRDEGTVEMIVRRPAVDAREVVDAAVLDVHVGLVGDTWTDRPSRHTADGSPDPQRQLTLASSRALAALAGDRDAWPLAGDQLVVDLDLSLANLPTGTRLRIGDAVVEVAAAPHTGCAKFTARFGLDATRALNSPVGQELRLRGINATVVGGGTVRTGDRVVVERPG